MQMMFSRIHCGSRCFSAVPANALYYTVAPCCSYLSILDGEIFSGSDEGIFPLFERDKMTKNKDPRSVHPSSAANDNKNAVPQIEIHSDIPEPLDLLEGEAELVSKFFQFLIPPNSNDN